MVTIKTAADKVSNIFVSSQIIEPKMQPIYSYGLELLFSGIVSVFGAGFAAILLKDFCGYLFFLAAFIPFRLWAGGYHADSHAKCLMCFICIYGMAYMLCEAMPLYWKAEAGILSIVSFGIIYCLAPLGHPNKKLTDTKIAKNRKRSRILAVTYMAAAWIVFFLPIPMNTYIIHLFSGQFLAAISLVAGKIKSQRRNVS